MDQRNDANRAFDRPVHRACVVAECWCGPAAATPIRHKAAPRRRLADPTSAPVDLAAWRSVGLPIA
jgi:hypothetical protein